jgi:dCMP deaminase
LGFETDRYYMNLARDVARMSPDPTTKCGAIIVNCLGEISGCGCNGFPRGIANDDRLNDRDLKNQMVVHAEIRAIIDAEQTDGIITCGPCILYCTHMPCVRCAAVLIDVGIKQVVAPAPSGEFLMRWGESIALTRSLFQEAGIKVIEYREQ